MKKSLILFITLVFVWGSFLVQNSKANLSWACTNMGAHSWNGGYDNWVTVGYCANASITGSISAAITAQDKSDISNLVTGSSIMSTINSNSSNAATRALNAYNEALAAKNLLNGASNGGKSLASTYDVANTASQNAQAAKTSADTASSRALTTINQTWDTSEGKSAATLSKEARDTAGNALTAINNTNSNLESKLSNLQNDLESKIGNIENSVINIQNYMSPTLSKVSGLNNSTATKTNSFHVTLEYSGANEYRYKLDNGSWSGWTSLTTHDTDGYLTISGISTAGMHTVYIEVRYNSGGTISPVSKGKINFFKVY